MKLLRNIQLSVLTSVLLVAAASAQDFEAYQKYLGDFPSGETDWGDDAQGLAHDDDNWFITQTHVIWKIPVELDLDTVTSLHPGVIYRPLFFYGELAGYQHLGDPDVYRHNGIDYLIMPMEHVEESRPGALAILRCSDLSYVGHVELADPDGVPYQGHDAGWCAVRSDGRIFSSVQHPGSGGGSSLLLGYNLDWDMLTDTPPQASILLEEVHAMHNEQGQPLNLITMQGGEFAPGDEFLYLISGFLDDDDDEAASEGLHVLRMDAPFSWQRMAHSTNGFGHFNYYYNPGFGFPCCLNPDCCTANEPEGLTIWDLDDGRAPNIRGQLHALMLDNDAPAVDVGDIHVYHYTNAIPVDPSADCIVPTCCTVLDPLQNCSIGLGAIPCADELLGMPECPFHTLADAVELAWPGAEIRIQTGTYFETITVSKRVRLKSEQGIVRIGG